MLQMARLFLCAFILISPISLGLAHAATCEDGYYLPDGATECQPNPEPEFIITTIDMVANTDFTFKLSAAGTFYIDWGDGTTLQVINKENADEETITHVYETDGVQTIKMSGWATAYGFSAIRFGHLENEEQFNNNIASVDGTLGAIFGTLSDGRNPTFSYLFNGCSELTSIPSSLFNALTGNFTVEMFRQSFSGCSKLAAIPSGLFGNLTGASKGGFLRTFSECTGLTKIPTGLFDGVIGGGESMFAGTFFNCSGLTGDDAIPSGLFDGVDSDWLLFEGTFSGCTGLTKIPSDLFKNITVAAYGSFYGTFSGCTGLSTIPVDLFSSITAVEGSYPPFLETFFGATNLSTITMKDGTQVSYIPRGFFAGTIKILTQSPFAGMFLETGLETSCPSDTIVDGTFSRYLSPKAVCIPEPKFTLNTTSDTNSFSLDISAAGTFYIYWGDGNIQTITKNDTTNTTYSHTYENADTYIIGLSGQATEYNTDEQTAAISFMSSASRIASIEGSLGAIFGTLSDGAQIQPRFYNTFYNAFNMNCSIPENLFDGIFGAPISYMFYSTFLGCNGLIGSIPKDLFARIFGRPADSMFAYTFYGCSGLIDSIPENLFAGISGAPASYMFYGTFEGCSGLTGSIPSGLFGKIEGVPAKAMFHNSFSGCSGLTGSIPSGLFGNLSGSPAESMFYGTFADCSGLAGEIPSGLFGDLTGSPASNMFNATFYNCSGLTSIPSGLFGAINGKPASRMFKETFAGCTGLRGGIPDNLFGNLSGNLPVYGYSFTGTFADCVGLTGPSAKIEKSFLYEIWPDADEYSYLGATGLSDYRYIPTIWGGLGYTLCKPGEYMPRASTECLTCKPGAYCVGGEFIYNDTTDQGINECPANSTSDAGATECKCNAGFTIDGLPDGAISTTDVVCMPKPEFTITTTDDTETFSFRISAAGSYTINWGDGSIENITKDNTADTTYSHTYERADTYTIGLSGQATAYITGVTEAAVSFSGNKNIVSIDGSLGAVFGTLSDGTNPLFWATFSDCVGLTSIPDDLFSGITGSRKSMFATTFDGCTGLTSIPENLFSGITGSAPELFFSTFSGCRGLTSIPEKLFSSISGAASSMFSHTFRDCEFLKSIPDKLFSTVSGAAATMFHGTFSGCTGLTSIPENLFSGITGPAESMFWYTFSDCTGLTSIPEKLFSGISGTASGMFMTTFNNCTSLTEIPENLFSGITEGAYGLFSGTFSDCTALKSIPENLFSNISSGALQMFSSTFAGCSSLTSVPGRLFSNVKASAEYMFDSTFSRCSGLTQIGDGLFGGISDGAKGLFSYTFSDCDSLSNIPGTLFKNLSGAAESMFAGTFSGCDGLRTVPGNLFGKITSVVPGMFSSTFNSCQNLTTIPVDLFASITGTPADSAFYATFAWSENIKEFVDSNGQSVSYIPVEFFSKMSKPTTYNKNMFEYVFAGTDLDESCPSGTIKATPYYANEVAPKVVCEVFEPNVKITTTDMVAGSYFILSISAAGEFLIDWNDGTPVQKITKTNTNEEYFYHVYETSGVREIGISGQATSYSSAISAVISFNNNTYIRSVDGSLGAIFGGNAVPYMFYQTFSYCENLENISDDLFDGISGVANSMFNSTFSGCRKLTEIPENLFRNITNTAEGLFGNTFSGCAGLTEIPENLFGGISGQPATSMFSGTFSNCENLTEIPAGLFEKISGAAYNLFGYTFSGCQNLTQIPSGLFSSISGGAQEMFAYTFDGCTGITKIPTGLFDGINVAEYGMFMGTFNNCIGLTGDDAIPSDLFSGITSANTSYLFNGTFAGCIGLTKIPSDLFSNIEGAGAGTFYGTFSGCVGLTEIPSDLFKSIQSTAPQETFAFTFSYCTGLETLPVDLFPNKLNLSGAQYPFMGIFDGATNISTITLTDGTTVDYIPREFFANMTSYNSQSFVGMFNSTALATACPSGTASDSILSGYLSPKAVCFNLSDPEFIITTTSDTTDFRFSISATGEYIIDWGDGTEITQITKNQAEFQEITHQYDKAMQYQIKMWGDATAYHSWLGAVSFSGSQNIETVSGSLGKIFGSLNDGKTQPLFTNTFSGCSNLTEIPNTLFDGIYGTPADFMFENTFSNCESLTRLPGGMFKNLYGAPSASMFAGTFAGCTGLTELPGDLFDGILAASRNQFSHTFSGCTGLTELPENLFSSLKRNFAPYMFYETFNSCSSLKTLPAKLFASLSGNLREATFMQTFLNCTGLETIPDELFATVSATGPDGFNGTFENCTALTTIPVGLFKSIVGRPSSDAFESVFYNATNLARFVFSDGKTVSFIPISFWDELSLDGYSESAFTLAFTGTKLADYCPSGSRPADVSYANEVAPKVVCIHAEVSCAPGEYVSESGAECQQCSENNICRGDWSEPESCHDLTNGEYPYSDAGRSDISDCYRTCDEYSLDECNLRPIDKFKAYYGEQCEYSCKTNNGFLCDIIDNQCHEIMCPNAYEYINGECVPCTRDHAIAFKDAPGCKVDTCEQDYYPDDEICAPDTILCSAPHAQTAVQEWDNNKKLYGKCMILECVPDWHVESNACVPDEESCEIANGTGVREWNHQTNSWGECIATRCDPGYTNDSSQTNEAWNQCGRCNNAYSAGGELAASSYVNECEIASCLYQGEQYTLENNECRLICDEYSDETGRRYWNDITKKCVHDCAAGYANW